MAGESEDLMSVEQRKALQEVLACQLRLWDAGNAAERLFNCDIDTRSNELDGFCCGLLSVDEAYDVPDKTLMEVFSLSEEDLKCPDPGEL